MNGQVINYTNCIKVLGVNLDSTLSGSDHCRAIVKKCYGALSRLKKCSECLPQDIKLTLVKSLVFPHLDSACGLFLDLASELSVKSQRCNNAALRFATGVRRYDHISPIYAKLNILRFEERRSYICLCLLANILATGRPDYIANQLQFRSTDTKGTASLQVRPACFLCSDKRLQALFCYSRCEPLELASRESSPAAHTTSLQTCTGKIHYFSALQLVLLQAMSRVSFKISNVCKISFI